MLACTRSFIHYLIIITFWIHLYQVRLSDDNLFIHLFCLFQIKVNLYLGALGLIFFYGAKVLGTSLVRYSLMKQLPHSNIRQNGDGFYQAESGLIALASRRSNEFEPGVANRTTVFQSTLLR